MQPRGRGARGAVPGEDGRSLVGGAGGALFGVLARAFQFPRRGNPFRAISGPGRFPISSQSHPSADPAVHHPPQRPNFQFPRLRLRMFPCLGLHRWYSRWESRGSTVWVSLARASSQENAPGRGEPQVLILGPEDTTGEKAVLTVGSCPGVCVCHSKPYLHPIDSQTQLNSTANPKPKHSFRDAPQTNCSSGGYPGSRAEGTTRAWTCLQGCCARPHRASARRH